MSNLFLTLNPRGRDLTGMIDVVTNLRGQHLGSHELFNSMEYRSLKLNQSTTH
ncbi:hypothetical protein [Budvicia aquatica]|uniref:hypothetical protein n=1 Tax=Budvicia aquatica TaxID=82979 RepID=UPI0004147ED0|nr:hypothetical protein [Budvicia aquatica]